MPVDVAQAVVPPVIEPLAAAAVASDDMGVISF